MVLWLRVKFLLVGKIYRSVYGLKGKMPRICFKKIIQSKKKKVRKGQMKLEWQRIDNC